MKENYTKLYPNEQVALAVGDYAYAHSTKLPKHITDHHAWGIESQERANYMISPLQAQFQVWFAKAMGAKRSESQCCLYYACIVEHVISDNILNISFICISLYLILSQRALIRCLVIQQM